MKKILTIILLSISLSGFSQTEKGDWVIIPKFEVGYSNDTKFFTNQQIVISGSRQYRYRVSTSVNYFLSDNFAVGGFLGISTDYACSEIINSYPTDRLNYEIGGNIRYNLLKSRFTPFIESYVGYNYRRYYFDIPQLPPEVRTVYKSGFSMGISVGISYFIAPRFGLQTSVNYNKFDYDYFSYSKTYPLTVGLGCLFIINNPRSEIVSPR